MFRNVHFEYRENNVDPLSDNDHGKNWRRINYDLNRFPTFAVALMNYAVGPTFLISRDLSMVLTTSIIIIISSLDECLENKFPRVISPSTYFTREVLDSK